ncbi:MAG: selenide, water dikinase SelD, partial [Pseudomonadota bacterium]
MQRTHFPPTRDLVLIGGGHTHALVLRRWAMKPLPGARVTLINPEPSAPYSGMLPGFVAGHYNRAALDIDLVRLARRAGARLVIGAACGIDPENRRIEIKGHPSVAYDVASIDIGITSAMDELPGFATHAVPAKPLGRFAAAWAQYREGQGPARIAVIGAGVAGAELAMAMSHAMKHRGREAELHLIDRGEAFSVLRNGTAQKLRAALSENRVILHENSVPEKIEENHIQLAGGTRIEADFVTGAAGAQPYTWLAQTGLSDETGFIPVDAKLRSRDPAVFAVGDCAALTHAPRPKAGVYAVRQAPVLFHNLRATLAGQSDLRSYNPQDDYLKLISLGAQSALAERFGTALAGPSLWRLKDWIDRRFMDQFRTWPSEPPPARPWPRAAGADALPADPLCGGCGAKVGPDALATALGGSLGDDAATLKTGDATQVISTDHLRGFCENPATVARVAANHALGDIWAMGAAPQAALAQIVLPRQSPRLAERQLSEIMAAARQVMTAAGAEIVGGHSTQGSELLVGFTVTGLCDTPPITLEGAQPGDALILTKPLGSGVLMAAEMQARASGADIAAAYEVMSQPQGEAAAILRDAH